MMSRMLGAPLGGTKRGGHQGVESLALSLIIPPNAGGGVGSWEPSAVVVALGEPATPVTTCEEAGAMASDTLNRMPANVAIARWANGWWLMLCTPSIFCKLIIPHSSK